jgi:pimeloyl-ACP methyl ester carboxylesterase
MTSRVLVLHGLWNARSWVAPLALRLRREGFDTRIYGYASIFGGPDAAIPALIERLREGEPVNLVGHSLGGLIALEALRREPSLPVPRLVCIGSPLSGSRTAAALAARAWLAPVLGRSRALLQRGCQPWTGPTEIGMVAGNVPRGVGRLLACLEGDSDGTVAVSETRLPGLRDHCVVPASHSGLVLSREAAAQTACFLRQGRFASDPALGGAGALE